jgi:peptidoglycan/xylan/chitin deacetylase (PgdA/CDA1 family)
MSRTIVTTSWDDGHTLDLRLAALLKKYDLAATFYIAPRNCELNPTERLTSDQISAIANDFEIGAHTMTHPLLSDASDIRAREEIIRSKAYLEQIVGRPVKCFCYPRGNYRASHVAMVKSAGYSYARTIRRFSILAEPSLESPTTVHASAHWSGVWQLLRMVRFNPFIFKHLYRRWDRQAMYLFQRTLESGGIFHLWGHSWEIDLHNDWDRLEVVFKSIAHHADVDYQCNGDLV